MTGQQNNRWGDRSVKHGTSLAKSRTKRLGNRVPQGVLGAGLAAMLVLALGTAGPVQADELDDRKQALEQEIAEVEESLEFLDADIVKTVTRLKEYQHQLPAAQQALSEAQGRVEEAAGQVAALSQRVDLALQTKDKINQQMADDEARLADTKKLIGQIATQAYKQGGVPTNLQLFFGSGPKAGLADTMSLADQALRTQNAALDRLSGQETERTCLSMVRRAPIPFPPEPLRSLVVAVTKWSMVRADESGRRNVWLRLLDRFGVGFDT